MEGYKTIDLNKWVSQPYLAKKLRVSRSAISMWVLRGKLAYIEVEELNQTLVENIDNQPLKKVRKKSVKNFDNIRN